MRSWESVHPTQSSLWLVCDLPAWSAELNVIFQVICDRNVLEIERPLFPSLCNPKLHGLLPLSNYTANPHVTQQSLTICAGRAATLPQCEIRFVQGSKLTLHQWRALEHWAILWLNSPAITGAGMLKHVGCKKSIFSALEMDKNSESPARQWRHNAHYAKKNFQEALKNRNLKRNLHNIAQYTCLEKQTPSKQEK